MNEFLIKIVQIIPLNLLIKLNQIHFILPFYHAISNEKLAHIENLYKVKNVEEFYQDLDFLLKNFEPIGLEQFISLQNIKDLKSTKKPKFLLTFDDGLSEFYSVIAPILKEKKVPAICFLNSSFIDNNNLFFRYKCSLIIEELKKFPEKISSIKFLGFNESNYKEKLLTLKYSDISHLDEIANIIGLDFEKFLEHNKPYLSSKQINELIEQGFYFGAHSIDHPHYYLLPLKEQIRQTKESVEEVCQKFDLKHRVFSFPFTDFGVSNSYFKEIEKNNFLDLSFGCAGQKKDSVKNNFQRIALEGNNLSAEKSIKLELLKSLIKKLLRKDIIYRND